MRARLACLLSLSTHCRQVPYLFKASFILGIYRSENRRRIYKSYRRMRRPTSYFENTDHSSTLMSRRFQLCMTGKFWSTILLFCYMESIYSPTLKVVVQNYNMMRFNHLWLTQIYLYQFYIPELIQLSNDIEVNPGPEISTDSLNLEDPNKKNYFFIEPCNTECQAFWCSALDLPLIVKYKKCSEMVKPLEKPSKLYRIVGDGNCLFHALSYVITGRQNYHSLVREKILKHMRCNEQALLAHINGSVNEYLARTGMGNQQVWGTDVEIIAASSLLETDIYVYTKVGFLYKWQRFSSSILSGYPAKNIGGLYLQNTSGVHYDIVLDVASTLTPHSNHGCKRKQNNEQSHQSKTKSVSISQPPKLAKANHEADTSKHVSFTLSSRDLAHISSDSDSELTSKNTVSSQNTDSDNEIHVKSLKKKAQHTSGTTNGCNKQTIDVSAQEHLSIFHKSIQYNMYQCKICFEAWPLKGKVKSKSAYICQRCSSDKKVPKKFSAGNQMIPSCIPNELQDLTQIEEMLIARALPIMNVYVKPGGQ